MFKKEMQEKLKDIFGVKKVTFADPGDSFEQDCIFIQVQECRSNVGPPRATAKVTGNIIMYCQIEKLSYGFFNKRIENAAPDLSKNFFFFDIDVDALNSPARIQNISERRTSFVYLYSAQYDPNQGQLTELELEGGY